MPLAPYPTSPRTRREGQTDVGANFMLSGMPLRHALLLCALAVTGCDRITGAAEQKTLDAEAIGYACRASSKAPADCISENETHSPTSLLTGWKAADADIISKVLDPSMGTNPAMAAHTKTDHPKSDHPKQASDQAASAPADEAAGGTTSEKPTESAKSEPEQSKKQH